MKNLLFQLVRYSWVGLLNSGLGLFVIWGLMLAGIGPYVANVAGFAAGLTLSFFLNRAWTFRAQDAGWPVFRFLLAFAIAYSANLVILTLSIKIAPEAVYASQLVAIGTYAVLFFLICRFYVFAHPGEASG